MVRVRSPSVYISNELSQRLRKLEPEHKLAKWINNMKDTLAENMYAGELSGKVRFLGVTLIATA